MVRDVEGRSHDRSVGCGRAVNVAVTVGAPVLTGVPSGTGMMPIVPDAALVLLAVLGAVALITRIRLIRG